MKERGCTRIEDQSKSTMHISDQSRLSKSVKTSPEKPRVVGQILSKENEETALRQRQHEATRKKISDDF